MSALCARKVERTLSGLARFSTGLRRLQAREAGRQDFPQLGNASLCRRVSQLSKPGQPGQPIFCGVLLAFFREAAPPLDAGGLEGPVAWETLPPRMALAPGPPSK
jgi:hypothetical protein